MGVVSPEKQSALPQFMILIYEREVPDGLRAASPTVVEAHLRLPRQIAETGGRILAGNAMRPASTAISVRDNTVVEGSLAGGPHALAGYFIVEASDLDHAVWIGRMIPVADGWTEIRPLLLD
ncbi:YciI family protein [Actinoplanes sp. CA-252034]|uniref:YciI family protein n=1 Tax=Actinoplanes sp. CA-252034 TaxID=3239906 RepID=UPI003D955DC8